LIASDTPIYKIVERLGQENIIVQAKIGARGKEIRSFEVKKDRESEIAQDLPGYAYIRDKWSHLLEGKSNMLKVFNTIEKKKLLQKLKDNVIDPLVVAYKNYFKKGGAMLLDSENIKGTFRNVFIRTFWASERIKQILREQSASEEFIQKVWIENIGYAEYDRKFGKALEGISQEKIDDAIGYAIFGYLLEKNFKGVDIEELPEAVNGYLIALDYGGGLSNLEQQLCKEKGLPLLFEKIAEACIGGTPSRFTVAQIPHFFIGAVHEASYYLTEKIKVLAEFIGETSIEKGDISEIGFYSFIEFNPNYRSVLSDFLTGEKDKKKGLKTLIEIYNTINKGIYYGYGKKDDRAIDLGWEVFRSIILSHHLKNSRKAGIDYSPSRLRLSSIISELPIDALSTIILDFFYQIAEGSEFTRTHIEQLVSPATSEGPLKVKKALAAGIWEEMFSRTGLSLLRYGYMREGEIKAGKSFKAPMRDALNFEIAKLLNEEIQGKASIENKPISEDNLDDIIEMIFADSAFKQKIAGVADDIYKLDIYGDDKEFYSEIEKYFSDNYKVLLRKSSVSAHGFELAWSGIINFYFDSGQKLTRDMLPDKAFIIKRVNGKYIKENLPWGQYPFESALMAVHDDSGNFGVIEAELIHDFDKILIDVSETIYEGLRGVYDENNIYREEMVVNGLHLCDSKGNYLIGKIALERTLERRVFKIRKGGNEWFRRGEFIRNRIVPETREIGGKNADVFVLRFYRSLSWITGERLASFLQETESCIIPTPKYSPIISGLKLKGYSPFKSGGKKGYKFPKFKSYDDLEKKPKYKIDAINSFLSQLDVYTPIRFNRLLFGTLSEVTLSDNIFRLSCEQSPSGELYSLKYFEEVFKNLKLSKEDLLDVNLPSDDSIEEDKMSGLSRKRFYNVFLKAFISSEKYLESLSFNLESLKDEDGKWKHFDNLKTEVSTESEFELFKALDEILLSLFGYEGFFMLQIGMLEISKQGEVYRVKPVASYFKAISTRMRKFGIRPISSWKIGGRDFLKKYSRLKEFIEYIGVCLIYGIIKDFFVDSENDFIQIISASGNNLLNDLTEEGLFLRPTNVKNFYLNYGSLYTLFSNKYRPKIKEVTARENLNAKKLIVDKLAYLLKKKFTEAFVKDFGEKVMNDPKASSKAKILGREFYGNPKAWSEKILCYALSQLYYHLILPGQLRSGGLSPAESIDKLLRDGSVDPIKLSSGRLGKEARAFYYDDEAKLKLDYELFKGIEEDIKPSLKYNYKNLYAAKSKSGGGGALWSYQPLDFYRHVVDSESRLLHTFKKFKEVISEYGSGQKFTAFFHKNKASGISEESELSEVYKKSGKYPELQRGYLEFTLEKGADGKVKNKNQLDRFAAELVFYLVVYGDYVIIKEGESTGDDNYALFASLRKLYDDSFASCLIESKLAKRMRLSSRAEGEIDGRKIYKQGLEPRRR